MQKLQKLIDKRAESARYMVDEITHICKDMPTRSPGTEGEKVACEYMAEVLKKDCGCERVETESFTEHPGSFFGWIYITATCALLNSILYFLFPLLGVVLCAFGFAVMIIQFGFYTKVIDFMFPKMTGHNVTAVKKCTGEVKARIFLNGHPDACWNWPVNNKFGGLVHEGHIAVSVIGALIHMAFGIVVCATVGIGPAVATPETYGWLFWVGIACLMFVPCIFGLYFMWDEHTIVDGANDNLTGCYMGIALLKAMKEEGIELENTEVGVILSGSEEAGIRGAKAWCKAHKGEFDDVPTWIISYDTIHDPKFLAVNYRDLNGMVKTDKEVGDAFRTAAKELNITCNKSMVPPFGGATDAAAFAQGGFRTTGITALNHVLEDYYHTLKDSYDNLNEECLADCYAVTARLIENFDATYSKVNPEK